MKVYVLYTCRLQRLLFFFLFLCLQGSVIGFTSFGEVMKDHHKTTSLFLCTVQFNRQT